MGSDVIDFIITDDQGYGDLGHTGNPIIRTPHIDNLADESSNLTDYHVAPTRSPARAALLTGRWTDRTGVWHTVNGRSMLRENEVTLAQMLKDAGYAAGYFGKWHLGDNYPYRPEDRGFAEVYRHGGGGVGQTPDVWDSPPGVPQARTNSPRSSLTPKGTKSVPTMQSSPSTNARHNAICSIPCKAGPHT